MEKLSINIGDKVYIHSRNGISGLRLIDEDIVEEKSKLYFKTRKWGYFNEHGHRCFVNFYESNFEAIKPNTLQEKFFSKLLLKEKRHENA